MNTPARITKCWVMLNERLSLNLNFFISEMGTMDVPAKDCSAEVDSVAKSHSPAAWEMHAVSPTPCILFSGHTVFLPFAYVGKLWD